MKIEGRFEKPRKITPPIKEELLSPEFLEKFNRGTLSIQSLSLVCPECGARNKVVPFAVYRNKNGRKVSQVKCPSCKKSIEDVAVTLRYYCGYVIADANVIIRGLLSKDLESSRFFEDFTVVLPAVVRKERDTKGGKKELERLARFALIGRIKLENTGKAEDVPANLSNIERDERIIQDASECNAIVITGDNSMKAHSIGRNLFTIFI